VITLNYLQLCQRVFIEGGISGQITSVQNQSGEALRVTTWVASAYREILNSDQFNLNFIRKSQVAQLTIGQDTYTKAQLGVPTLGQWDTDTMRVAINANLSDETFLIGQRFPDFRDYWDFSSRRDVLSRPLNCTVTPETNLRIGPKPSAAFYLNFQWIAVPADLQDDEDVPVIPDRWHMAIVWRALRHYGMFESAPEVVMRADTNYREVALLMTLDQSPEIVVGSPIC
jgi:hypothetical protein